MPIDILMPALSPTMTEGTLAKWHKKEGDTVAAGDVIAEIETDKATMEVEAVDEGTIGKILVNEGTAGVAVNTPIAVLLEEGESAGAAVKSGGPAKAPPKATAPQSHPEAKPKDIKPSAPTQNRDFLPSAQNDKSHGERIFASPLAKRIAAEKGIDLSSVHGSGPHGRIVRADLEGAHAGPAKAPAQHTPAAAPKAAAPAQAPRAVAPSGPDARQLADLLGQKYKAVPNNSIRKVVAKRLLESKQTVPHFYLTVEYKIDALLRSRAELNDQANGRYKLSVNDFIIKACANALRKYPAANAAWTDDAILLYEHADISVAVATPNGLMTPIVKQAESKGLREISEEVKDLAARAREGKLKPEEFQGGSFTISNLGMYGIESFGAIINPPQACILAVGAGVQKPYVEDGQVKIGTFMNCTLSVDHRAVDGAVGAEFLQILKQFVEMPSAMLL